MRSTILCGSILITCLVITTVKADRKWKYNYDNPYSYDKSEDKQVKKAKNSKNQVVKNFEESEEETKDVGNSYQKKHKKDNVEEASSQKRFIGRIEHGKIKVLRRKEDKNESDESGVKVCRKSGKTLDCDEYDDEDSSEENGKPKKPVKKMKYSIKFQHEKQKKKENNEDISVMRLHKNGRKQYGKHDDDDASEEDDSPIKRRRFAEEDD